MDFDANLSTLTYESGPCPSDEFPRSAEPVCILGRMYSTLHDMEELKDDIRSRIWCTYRKNFISIGSSGQTTDTGWGCMLRCGQMMLAHTLVLRHLSRDWRWQQGKKKDEKYWRLLRMFQDKKACVYSIHQIASMGESEGKSVGQWFGPNTIAQVLKRIVCYDEWSNINIYVALDNTVIEDEIREGCRKCSTFKEQSSATAAINGDGRDVGVQRFSRFVNDASPTDAGLDQPGEGQPGGEGEGLWQPLLLIVPLRLGLTDINPIYFDALKRCLNLPYSVGIIGGKPNHAHWFVGYVGDELIYLDPHTTQVVGDLDDPEERAAADESYHCRFSCRMNMLRLDPSVAVGFFCDSEKAFDDLCQSLRSFGKKNMMFEICKERPPHLPYNFDTVPPSLRKKGTAAAAARMSDASGSSVDDEEFEII
ncbi:cysteine protease ATG4B-like isoform X2 [Babylonia areolata]|uniref:cysteine protease ATG4B-like isoform X2 n=1 Tax=Babylonia areolata TaxID=304850 RepID=UPI003FD61393